MSGRDRAAGWLLLLFVLSAGSAASAAVQVGAELDRDDVAVGEQGVLTVTVNGEARDVRQPILPEIDGLEIYGGGQSQRFSFINGQVSAVHSFTFYLRPLKEGTFHIDPIVVEVDGRKTPVRAVDLQVHAGPTAPRAEGSPSAPPSDSGDADVFVTLTVDQDSVVVGQQVVMTFGYYRATRTSAFDSPEYTPPRTEGFWREDLPPERRTTRIVRSRRYAVTEIRYALFPTHAGDLEIGPAELRLSEDLFGSFFRSRQGRGPRLLKTEPKVVHVAPLPPTRQQFTGAVGRDFRLTASVDRQELAVGEALTLEIRLEGDGHLASASDPVIDGGAAFRVHEAGGGVDSRPTPGGLHGVRVVQKLLIPTKEGHQVLPSVEYKVFDTQQMSYRTLRTQPLAIDVAPAEGGATPTLVAGGRQSEIELLSRDIMHIRAIAPDLRPQGRPFVRHPVFWGALALPILVWASSGQVARRRRALLADPRRVRSRRAHARAKARLAETTRSVDERVDSALRGYLADRADLAPAGLRREDLRGILAELGAGPDEEAELLAMLDECDAQRFAPSAGDAGSLQARAAEFISRLERRRED